jgi:hypothetical protein
MIAKIARRLSQALWSDPRSGCGAGVELPDGRDVDESLVDDRDDEASTDVDNVDVAVDEDTDDNECDGVDRLERVIERETVLTTAELAPVVVE